MWPEGDTVAAPMLGKRVHLRKTGAVADRPGRIRAIGDQIEGARGGLGIGISSDGGGDEPAWNTKWTKWRGSDA